MDFRPLQRFLDHLTSWRIPGNAIHVCLEGKKVFSSGSGYADVENQIPMTPDHYLNIYSCSKVATVTAALQLYEQGKFLLDDPLYEFIPEYREMTVSDKNGVRKAEKPITLRHLFTMTSGLTYNRNAPAFEKAQELTDGKMDTLTVIRCLAQDPLASEPGEVWRYSLSHDVLAAVVEVISGEKFGNYVQNHIFKPLGMEKVFYHNEAVQDKMAVQYRYVDGVAGDLVARQAGEVEANEGRIEVAGPKVGFVLGPEYDSGGAGITTTVAEYSKFCVALANGGVGATGERILAPGTIELLRTNQLSERQQKGMVWPQLKGYGYGLGVRTMVDRAASGSNGNVGEFGWNGAAGGSVILDPQIGLSVFYAHHMLNNQEPYFQPRLRNVIYSCL